MRLAQYKKKMKIILKNLSRNNLIKIFKNFIKIVKFNCRDKDKTLKT